MERPKLNDVVEVYPVLTRMAYAYRHQQKKDHHIRCVQKRVKLKRETSRGKQVASPVTTNSNPSTSTSTSTTTLQINNQPPARAV